jgi:hypothetical protein
VEESAVVCVHCGQATDAPVPAAPPASTSEHTPVPAGFEQQPTAPLFSAVGDSADRGLTGIGGWLILPAIGLALNPFIALFGLAVGLLLLFGSEGQIALAHKPGLEPVILFEIFTNIVFLTMLIVLNIFFYQKKKAFPTCMIIFLGTQFVFLLADHLMAAPLNPHSSPATVIRSLVVCAIWIPYFLRSRRVELTFVN